MSTCEVENLAHLPIWLWRKPVSAATMPIPNTPRRDFRLNDVMGGIVITLPVGS